MQLRRGWPVLSSRFRPGAPLHVSICCSDCLAFLSLTWIARRESPCRPIILSACHLLQEFESSKSQPLRICMENAQFARWPYRTFPAASRPWDPTMVQLIRSSSNAVIVFFVVRLPSWAPDLEGWRISAAVLQIPYSFPGARVEIPPCKSITKSANVEGMSTTRATLPPTCSGEANCQFPRQDDHNEIIDHGAILQIGM